MTPSTMDYPQNENESNVDSTQQKFNTGCYKHKKFGKRASKDDTPTAPPLFRPYALSENSPRKRRKQVENQQKPLPQQQHQLPPTPPTTPPQLQQQQQHPHYTQRQQLQQVHRQQPHQQQYMPTTSLNQMYTPTATPTPFINHQAYAYVLQKQRSVLQIRQMLSINPDANTWPAELRNVLYSMLQR